MLTREYLMLLVAPVVLELVGLCFAVASDPYLSQRHRRMMFLIIGLIAALIAQNLVNGLAKGYDTVARDVINGKYGNDQARINALRAKGYDPAQVQAIVNGMLK